jgi:transcription antitermination protein NusB
MGARRRGRELALQVLYQIEVSGERAGTLQTFFEQAEAVDRAKAFAAELVAGVREHQEQIDKLIAAASEHWRFERLSRVDLGVLRIASYELLAGHAPLSVVLDEAIEIARRFGTEESPTFVNGILDQIAKQLGVSDSADRGVADDE